MDIYELLGEDPDAPGHKHARSLVAADHAMVRDLVAVRERSGMTQADVARTMGTRHPSPGSSQATRTLTCPQCVAMPRQWARSSATR